LKIRIDRARCSGHGRCYTLVPELFEADDDGYSLARTVDVPEALEDRARVGAQNCPELAITLTAD